MLLLATLPYIFFVKNFHISFQITNFLSSLSPCRASRAFIIWKKCEHLMDFLDSIRYRQNFRATLWGGLGNFYIRYFGQIWCGIQAIFRKIFLMIVWNISLKIFLHGLFHFSDDFWLCLDDILDNFNSSSFMIESCFKCETWKRSVAKALDFQK